MLRRAVDMACLYCSYLIVRPNCSNLKRMEIYSTVSPDLWNLIEGSKRWQHCDSSVNPVWENSRVWTKTYWGSLHTALKMIVGFSFEALLLRNNSSRNSLSTWNDSLAAWLCAPCTTNSMFLWTSSASSRGMVALQCVFSFFREVHLMVQIPSLFSRWYVNPR